MRILCLICSLFNSPLTKKKVNSGMIWLVKAQFLQKFLFKNRVWRKMGVKSTKGFAKVLETRP